MNENMLAKTHPLILFWIGVLTGAVVVVLIFMYRQGGQLQNTVVPPQNIQQLQKVGPRGPNGRMPLQMKTGSAVAPAPQPFVGQ